MKTHYSIPVLLLIVLWVVYYQERVGNELVHFIEMSEREGSLSLND